MVLWVLISWADRAHRMRCCVHRCSQRVFVFEEGRRWAIVHDVSGSHYCCFVAWPAFHNLWCFLESWSEPDLTGSIWAPYFFFPLDNLKRSRCCSCTCFCVTHVVVVVVVVQCCSGFFFFLWCLTADYSTLSPDDLHLWYPQYCKKKKPTCSVVFPLTQSRDFKTNTNKNLFSWVWQI